MIDKLRERGVAQVVVRFNGSGDEGYVDEIEAFDAQGGQVELTQEEKAWADNLSDLADWDWYNNEGGGGVVTVSVAEGTALVEGHWNEIIEREVDSYERAL